MSGNAILDRHAAELSAVTGFAVEVHQDGNKLFVVVRGYQLPTGVAKVASTDVLFLADTQYPLSEIDMFWTDVEVVQPDGSIFEKSTVMGQHLGRDWRRFSYHRNGTWSSAGNPLLNHYSFMESRWAGETSG